MTEELKKFEKTIKKKHSIAWSPKYQEEFRTGLSSAAFKSIGIQTFEKFSWDLVYQDENTLEGMRRRDLWQWGQKITIKYSYGKVTVLSESLGNEFWDMGRNSKRVKLFIYAFKLAEGELDRAAIAELEKQVEIAENWDDYEIPDMLPKPRTQKKPKLWIPVFGGIVSALLIGFLVAFISLKGIYLIGLIEIGVGFLFGYVLKYFIKLGNYTGYTYLNYLIIAMVLVTYVANQYFQYRIILYQNNLDSFGFFDFLKYRLSAGLTIKSLNTGWIGLILSWIFQLGFTYFITTLRVILSLTKYQLERIPPEVRDFAYYHFVKDKTEKQVREELSKMGWNNSQNQDEVFESIGAIDTSIELSR